MYHRISSSRTSKKRLRLGTTHMISHTLARTHPMNVNSLTMASSCRTNKKLWICHAQNHERHDCTFPFWLKLLISVSSHSVLIGYCRRGATCCGFIGARRKGTWAWECFCQRRFCPIRKKADQRNNTFPECNGTLWQFWAGWIQMQWLEKTDWLCLC